MIDDTQLKRMEAENIACGDAENEWLVRNARRHHCSLPEYRKKTIQIYLEMKRYLK